MEEWCYSDVIMPGDVFSTYTKQSSTPSFLFFSFISTFPLALSLPEQGHWGQSRLSSLGSLDPTSSIAESLVLFSPEWASWVKEKELVMVPDRFHFYMVGRVRRSNYCLLLRPDWQPSGGRRYEDNGKGEKSRQWACRDHVRRQVWALHADHTTHVAKYIYTFHLNFTHICVTRR